MASFMVLSYVIAALALLMVTAFPQPLDSDLENHLIESRSTESDSEVIEDPSVTDRQHKEDFESESAAERRKAVRNEARRWPDAVIPYDIQSSVESISPSARSLIRSAMDYWESQTCLRFVQYNPKTDKDYIVIQKGSWCNSIPGRRGGAQPLNLALGCLKFGSIVHELGHATGWVHEHARPDRDNYIEILWNKTKTAEEKKQLDKYDESIINTYGIPYDYGSIMHYNGTSGTIRARDPTKQKVMGQREKLSFYDVKLSNVMYKCAERNKCDLKEVTCKSDGYVGPKCTCVCPDGTDSCSTKKHIPRATADIGLLPTVPERCSEWISSKGFRKLGQSGIRIFNVDVESCTARCRSELEFVCLSADYHPGVGICYINPESDVRKIGDFEVTHYERNPKCSGDGKKENEETESEEFEVVG